MYKIFSGVFLAFLLLAVSSCGKKEDGAPGAAKAKEGYIAINKALESGDVTVIDTYVDKDAVGHSPMQPGPVHGVEEVKKFFGEFHTGFPDAKVEIKSIAIAGDTLFGLYRMTATNSGSMMGMPATGKKVDVMGVDVMRFNSDGKLVEHWDFGDNYGFMKQLGLIPDMSLPAPAASAIDSSKMMMEKK